MKQNLFTMVKTPAVYHNTFDASHDRKFSAKMGELIPILCEEALPGDNFKCTSNHLIRMAPMLAPMMHKVDVYMHFWKVPIRILWNGYDDFYNSDGENYPDYPFFYLESLKVRPSSISDYLGFPLVPATVPPPLAQQEKCNALFHFAYYKIWYEFYRDQNLQTSLPDMADVITDGDNSSQLEALLLHTYPFKRAWEKDYFTSALPYPQKGNAVTLPLGTTADLRFLGHPDNSSPSILYAADGSVVASGDLRPETGSPDPNRNLADNTDNLLKVDVTRHTTVDLTSALAATINDLRLAEKIQEFLELRARGGTRYSEYLKSVWNVRTSDARLQRPEYLGGSKTPINISEVLQTSETNDTPLAEMAGHGISVSNMNGFSTYCEEHSIIIGLMSIMPKPSYYQGLRKQFSRLHPFDHYQPPFAQLGEQAVLNKELYFTEGSPTSNNGTFGYQARWAEYRDIPSTVHGSFRTTEKYWHLAMDFESLPSLNAEFIKCNPSDRIFAVQSLETRLDNMWCHVIHNLYIKRPLPMFNVPSLV